MAFIPGVKSLLYTGAALVSLVTLVTGIGLVRREAPLGKSLHTNAALRISCRNLSRDQRAAAPLRGVHMRASRCSEALDSSGRLRLQPGSYQRFRSDVA